MGGSRKGNISNEELRRIETLKYAIRITTTLMNKLIMEEELDRLIAKKNKKNLAE